jgi:hypothetical protein
MDTIRNYPEKEHVKQTDLVKIAFPSPLKCYGK